LTESVSERLIVERWREARRLLEEGIGARLRELGEYDELGIHEYIVAGGKRLRGFATLLIAEAMGSSWSEALDAAVAVEIVHSASLAIDDVIDGDEVRRGRAAAWLKYGPGRAVMAANLLISFAQRLLLLRYGYRAVERSVVAWYDISRGEVLDAYTGRGGYLEVVRLKTGSLFRLAAELGGVVAGVDNERLSLLGRYGELMGVAYQLADDIVDYMRGERDGSVVRLLEWLGNPVNILEAALPRLRSLFAELDSLAQRLFRGFFARMASLLPRFVVKSMFREAGLEIPGL